MLVGHTMQDTHTLLQLVLLHVGHDLLGVWSGAADDDQRHIGWQIGQRLNGLQHVFTRLDRTYIKNVTLGQLIMFGYLLQHGGIAFGTETLSTTLVDERYFLGWHLTVLDDVATGTFADGNDMGGLAQGASELPCVELYVDGIVKLGMTQENKIVDGNHAGDAALTDAKGKFARQTMIELDAIALKIGNDTLGAPVSVAQWPALVGKLKCYIGALCDLVTQRIATSIGGIETELQGILCQIVNQRAAIGTKTCAVANNALGIEANM